MASIPSYVQGHIPQFVLGQAKLHNLHWIMFLLLDVLYSSVFLRLEYNASIVQVWSTTLWPNIT